MTNSSQNLAPVAKISFGHWVKKNLFRNPLDSALTVVFGGIAIYAVIRAILFVLVNARWDIIVVNLKLLMIGRWPVEHLWRVAVALVVLAAWAGLIAGLLAGRKILKNKPVAEWERTRNRWADLARRYGLIIVTVLLLLALTKSTGPWVMSIGILIGGAIGFAGGKTVGQRLLPTWAKIAGLVFMGIVPIAVFVFLVQAVPLANWEGFMFNISSAAAGIVLSFPLGLLLALGRRSKLTLLKWISIFYIEVVRGAPLYVLLLLANVSLEFFVPASMAPSKVIRAVVTFTLFTAAYIAEIVRGGLQSVPNGQGEAAKALGLRPTTQMSRIVLPQALRNVIPAQIGQFISLFKDTTLAGLGLGILDLLTGAGAITQQPDFRGQGLIIETLVFVGFLFWVGSYTMSRESQRLERRLGIGVR